MTCLLVLRNATPPHGVRLMKGVSPLWILRLTLQQAPGSEPPQNKSGNLTISTGETKIRRVKNFN